MTKADLRVQPSSADIASKVIDGEAIIINLANGVYYSLDGVGGVVWEQICAVRGIAEIVSVIVGRYDVSHERAAADVGRLVEQLFEENLVTGVEGEPTATVQPPVARRLPYEPPTLNIYRDMGDLLALDPPTPGLDSPWQEREEART